MTTNIDELKDWAEAMTEPAGYYDEEKDDSVELTTNPKADEIKRSLNTTRTEVGMALRIIAEALIKQDREMDKMRNHRHDNSKQFGGRPEL